MTNPITQNQIQKLPPSAQRTGKCFYCEIHRRIEFYDFEASVPICADCVGQAARIQSALNAASGWKAPDFEEGEKGDQQTDAFPPA